MVWGLVGAEYIYPLTDRHADKRERSCVIAGPSAGQSLTMAGRNNIKGHRCVFLFLENFHLWLYYKFKKISWEIDALKKSQ